MSSPKKTNKPDATISNQLEELERLVAWFDSQDFELEEALKKYDQAQKVAEQVEKRLSEIKNKVDVLKRGFDE